MQHSVMRYAELNPEELAAEIEKSPVAIWPIGALEWHGPHLPLGLDGIVAEAFAARLRERVGGVLLPCLWHPITTLPHPMSLDVDTVTFRAIVRHTVLGLGKAGFMVVCAVTGHYAQGHSLELFHLGSEFTRNRREPTLIAASPLEPLEDEALLDHAAKWEAAQLLRLRPELVKLDRLPEKLNPKSCAVLGEDPRLARPEELDALEERALDIWERWIHGDLAGRPEELLEFYIRRKNSYASYVARHYRTSWEQAIEDWWQTQR